MKKAGVCAFAMLVLASSADADEMRCPASVVRVVAKAERNTVAGPQSLVAPTSGVVLDAVLPVVATTYHSVRGATSLTLDTGDAGEAVPVRLVGYDAGMDFAILGAADPAEREALLHFIRERHLTAAIKASRPESNQAGVACGFPLQKPLLASVVQYSAVPLPARQNEAPEYFLKIDAGIYPGESGGGLFTKDGKFAGLLESIVGTRDSKPSADSFAIPAQQLERLTVQWQDKVLGPGT